MQIFPGKTIAVQQWLTGFFLMAATMLLPAQVFAVEPGEMQNILSSYKPGDKNGNIATRKALIADGRERALFCAYCHGYDGNSKMPLVPNLAGQNPFYLLEQIEKFADGRREDYVMTPLARHFSTEDKIALSIYYANMKSRPKTADSKLALKGKKFYLQKCVSCHGKDAHGGKQYARLAGQHAQYLRRRIYSIQNATGKGATVMTRVAKTLSEEEVEALAAYISTLP